MVQTFLVEESKDLIHDVDSLDEWKKKCEELGLTGQLALASPEKSPIPFEHMNTVSQRVYETLCPAKVEFSRYNKTAIPLEVLALIHLSVNERYFDKIEVWYDDKTPDPIVVGFKGKNGWEQDLYSIARWGDVLKPFEELKKVATKRFTAMAKLDLQKKIKELNLKLSDVDLNSQLYFEAQLDRHGVHGYY